VTTHVALLRGINVGGKNMVPKAALIGAFENAGATNVRTYIQSGNVVFDSPTSDKVSARVSKRLGVPVVTRTASELTKVVTNNPFLARGEDKCHVVFLADRPAKGAALDPERSPGDEFAIVGREVYLFLPNGVGKSKLTNDYLDRRLGTTSTVRNWRTVLKLVEMLG